MQLKRKIYFINICNLHLTYLRINESFKIIKKFNKFLQFVIFLYFILTIQKFSLKMKLIYRPLNQPIKNKYFCQLVTI